MNSRLSMILDANNGNQAAIRVQAVPSEDDLRDQVFQIFVDSFRSDQSRWCRIEFERQPLHEAASSAPQPVIILPVNDVRKEFLLMHDFILSRIRETPCTQESDPKVEFADQLYELACRTRGGFKENLTEDGIRITRDSLNRIRVAVDSESERFDDCSLAMIKAIRFMLKTMTSTNDIQKGKAYRELMKLWYDMGPIITGSDPFVTIESPLINGKKTVANWLESIPSLNETYSPPRMIGWFNYASQAPGIFLRYLDKSSGQEVERQITPDDLSDKMNDISKSNPKYNFNTEGSVFLEIHGQTHLVEFVEKNYECAPSPTCITMKDDMTKTPTEI